MKNIILVMMLAITLVACGERIKPDGDATGEGGAADDAGGATGER